MVNSSVGKIQKDIFTLRHLQLCQLISEILLSDPKNFDGKAISPVAKAPSQQMMETIDQCLLDKSIELEARAQSFETPLVRDVPTVVKMAQLTLRQNETWKKLQWRDSELQTAASEKILGNAYLEAKMKSFDADLTDRDLKAEYELNKDQYESLDFELVKEKVKLAALAKKREGKLNEWFLLLKERYQIQNLVQLPAETAGPRK